jgi:hypothetical protein
MKGHLGHRGDAWELRVYIGIDPVTHKQRYATKSFRGGKREAQRLLAEMLLDAQRGLSVASHSPHRPRPVAASVAMTRGRDENLVLVVTDAHDLAEARDVIAKARRLPPDFTVCAEVTR